MTETPRIIFMGTPEFALPTLEALIASRYAVVGVVTQPDRPAGRGRGLHAPPVKQAALEQNLPVFQPKTLRTPQALARLQEWAPDVIVTAATGHILTPEVLRMPRQGTVNVHGSLLPRWRGAAPLQATILAGDPQTGITIMCTDEGIDTGPLLSQRGIPLAPRETVATLHDKLAQLGAQLLIETLPRWLSGELQPQPQPEEGVTHAEMIRKEDGLIDWQHPAPKIDRQIRAFTPWPSAYTFWEGQRLIVAAASPTPTLKAGEPPGKVIEVEGLPAVVTGEGVLRLERLQLAGKRVLAAAEFVRGRPDFIGVQLKGPEGSAFPPR